jgi:hypothetical protein
VRLLQGRHVETEFAGVADVDERVLQGDGVAFRLQSEADHRGLAPSPREEGDRSQTPSVDTVLIQPIARGNILPISSL